MTTAEAKAKLLKQLRKIPGVTVVTIPFRDCDDVPKFLKKLDAIERRSRKSKLFIG